MSSRDRLAKKRRLCGPRTFLSPTLPFILLGGFFVTSAGGDAPPVPSKNVLVTQYCIGCHNNSLMTAGLSLEGLDPKNVGKDAEVWERVLRKLQAKEMPPAGLPRPSPSEQEQFTEWLEGELNRAAPNPNPGHPTIHRLNRNEYSNAIRDLLALDVKPGESLPLDDSGYGFDNIGDVLSFSPVLLERYLSVARMIAGLAVGNTDVKPVINTFAPAREVRAKAKPTGTLNEQISEELPFGSAGGLSLQYTFPVDAEYVFKIRLPGSTAGFDDDGAAPVGQVIELRIPVEAGVHHVGVTFIRSGAVPEFARVHENRQLDLRLDGTRLKLYEVPEGEHGPAITDLSIAGPYNITGPGKSASRQRIFVCNPASTNEEDGCARKILSTLARRAFRRTPGETDVRLVVGRLSCRTRRGQFQ